MHNPIDSLLNQIDDNTDLTDSCTLCHNQPNHLYKLSCNHLLCLTCIAPLIQNKKHQNCPDCNSSLAIDLETLYKCHLCETNYAKLVNIHGFQSGDRVWTYSGNSGNWLYTKANCDAINTAFSEYLIGMSSDSESDSDDSSHLTEIQVNTGHKVDTYIINFNIMRQYPKNDSSKFRSLRSFVLSMPLILDTNKVVGVAGKVF